MPVKWLLAPTFIPIAFMFTWAGSPGKRCCPLLIFPAGFAVLLRVLIVSPYHGSVRALPEEVIDSSRFPERDRPDGGVTKDAAVRLPDHALYGEICTKVWALLVRTTRFVMGLHAPARLPVSCPYSPEHGHDDALYEAHLSRIHRWTRTEGVRTQEGGVRKLQTRWPGLEFG